jgi:hypothetical protein
MGTRAAGLFYLVRPILELDLAPHLYYAGLFEGAFLGHVLSLLVDDDPAPWVVAGEFDLAPPELASVASWAADEVWQKARSSLVACLRARGLPSALDDELRERVDVIAAPLIETARARGHEPVTAELLARMAALLAFFFQARLEQPGDAATLRGHLAIDGSITITAEEIVATLPMSAVDVDLRRAGLDQDPGWVPWLERKVWIEFAALECDESAASVE